MVVELSLRRPAHGTVNDATDKVSAQPAASGKCSHHHSSACWIMRLSANSRHSISCGTSQT